MQVPRPTDRSTRMPAASLSLFQAMPIPCHRRSHRYRRVAGLVLTQPNEAAAAGELEGAAGFIDRVGDVHGRSLADSLRRHSESGEGLCDECYRRATTPPTTPAVKLPRVPAHRPCAEGIPRLPRVPDSGMHADDRVRGVRDGAEATYRRSYSGPLTALRSQ